MQHTAKNLSIWLKKNVHISTPPPPPPQKHGKEVLQTLKWLSYVKQFGKKYSVQLKAELLIKCCTSTTISPHPHLLWEETTTLPPMQMIADRHAIFSACNLQSHPESSDQHPCDQQNNYQPGRTGQERLSEKPATILMWVYFPHCSWGFSSLSQLSVPTLSWYPNSSHVRSNSSTLVCDAKNLKCWQPYHCWDSCSCGCHNLPR